MHGPDATGAAADPLAIEPAPGAGHHDLRGRDDLAALIEAFYLRAFADPFIGPIFTDVAKMDLAHHLPIMCDFWESVLFDAGTYRRNALGLHVALDANHPLTEAHFERWLVLWRQTVDDGFTGDVADRAKVQGERIAASIRRRLAGGTGSAYETITTRERLEEGGTIDGPRSDGTTGGEG
ncbi:group III truncated hemoglobin [Agromyces italicus]|uniref:group III truncated hemoglobin n=1 Tax=Agromyces italicus TaxID=279572 RepID=UPI0003FBE62D|nr:group III truncated hemoglobin [Agromyces italicus]